MADSTQCGTHVIRNTSLITRSSCITPPSICNPGNQRRSDMLTSTTPSARYGLPWSVLQMPRRIKSSLPRIQANSTKRYARRSVRPANPRMRRRNSQPRSICRRLSSKWFPGMSFFCCRRHAVPRNRLPTSSPPRS